jgi:hypothetical protein
LEGHGFSRAVKIATVLNGRVPGDPDPRSEAPVESLRERLKAATTSSRPSVIVSVVAVRSDAGGYAYCYDFPLCSC